VVGPGGSATARAAAPHSMRCLRAEDVDADARCAGGRNHHPQTQRHCHDSEAVVERLRQESFCCGGQADQHDDRGPFSPARRFPARRFSALLCWVVPACADTDERHTLPTSGMRPSKSTATRGFQVSDQMEKCSWTSQSCLLFRAICWKAQGRDVSVCLCVSLCFAYVGVHAGQRR